MFRLNSIHLTNYLLWDDVEFKFEEGITHVYGANRSGKSLLFSPLPALLYDRDQIPKNSRATLNLDVDGKNIDATVFNNAKTKNRFQMVIDGKEQNTDTIDAAKNLISTYITDSLQSSIFDTTVMISGLGKHPLADGKPSSRLDWVHETLAYASQLDAYSEIVEEKFKAFKEDSIKYGLYKSEYNDLEPVEKPTSDVEELSNRLKTLGGKIKQLEQDKRNVEAALDYSGDLVKPKYSSEKCSDLLEEIDSSLENFDRLRSKYVKYKDSQKENSKLKTKIDKAKTHYTDICNKYGLKVIKPSKFLSTVDDKVSLLKNSINEYERLVEAYENQKEIRALAKKTCKWDDPVAYDRKIEELRGYISIQKSTLSAHKSGKKHCEMCGNNLRLSAEHVNKIKGNLDKAKKKLAKYETEQKISQAKNIKLVKKPKVDPEYLHRKTKALKLAKEAAQNYDNLPKLKSIEKVNYDAKEHKKLVKRRKTIQDMLVAAQTYETLSQQKNSFADNKYVGKPKNKLSRIADNIGKELSAAYKEQSNINDELVSTRTQYALYQNYVKKKRSLRDKCREYSKAERNHNILKVLRKALGRDGFRTKRLESTLELFVDNLNSLAPLIWDEPYKFDIETGPRKCNLIIHRNKVAGSAFTTSGSENRNLQILAALAMLRLLPDNRRCDTIILDEIEANMDMSSRHKMMKEFIIEVQKTVPNVVVVSPLTRQELGLQPDQAYRVTKRNAKSTLSVQ
jgi:recombinational DNA repair ATPase RecF